AAGAALDEETAGLLTARLRALLARLDGHGEDGGQDFVASIDSASDDDIFQFIDSELGTS
ncbi:hypothetical protein, partial [Amycolatopsis sp. SID8362]|uniref:hypothetical protein n=1 Tax=Amycolatopsis sp. SID8362 TaxID=2690346 RepID=UPI00136E3FED